MRRGVTLIELLIVVSIIAILATVAVPNFLEAQTRAKVARVLSDTRTMQVAVESYAADQGVPPRMTFGGRPWYDRYSGDGVVDQPISGTLGYWITTPVAYLNRFDFLDPFVRQSASTQYDARLYTYQDALSHPKLETFGWNFGAPFYITQFRSNFGEYCMMSIGPDQQPWSNEVPTWRQQWESFWIQYDATNGTISDGNVWRGERMRASTVVRWEYEGAPPSSSNDWYLSPLGPLMDDTTDHRP